MGKLMNEGAVELISDGDSHRKACAFVSGLGFSRKLYSVVKPLIGRSVLFRMK
jgi:hypothetical protein